MDTVYEEPICRVYFIDIIVYEKKPKGADLFLVFPPSPSPPHHHNPVFYTAGVRAGGTPTDVICVPVKINNHTVTGVITPLA